MADELRKVFPYVASQPPWPSDFLAGRAKLGEDNNGVSILFPYSSPIVGPSDYLMFRGATTCTVDEASDNEGIAQAFPYSESASGPSDRLMARAVGCKEETIPGPDCKWGIDCAPIPSSLVVRATHTGEHHTPQCDYSGLAGVYTIGRVDDGNDDSPSYFGEFPDIHINHPGPFDEAWYTVTINATLSCFITTSSLRLRFQAIPDVARSTVLSCIGNLNQPGAVDFGQDSVCDPNFTGLPWAAFDLVLDVSPG